MDGGAEGRMMGYVSGWYTGGPLPPEAICTVVKEVGSITPTWEFWVAGRDEGGGG